MNPETATDSQTLNLTKAKIHGIINMLKGQGSVAQMVEHWTWLAGYSQFNSAANHH